jgi:hypothetical protein
MEDGNPLSPDQSTAFTTVSDLQQLAGEPAPERAMPTT